VLVKSSIRVSQCDDLWLKFLLFLRASTHQKNKIKMGQKRSGKKLQRENKKV